MLPHRLGSGAHLLDAQLVFGTIEHLSVGLNAGSQSDHHLLSAKMHRPVRSSVQHHQQCTTVDTAVHKYFFIHLMYGIAVQLCNKCRSIALQASEQLTNSAPADLPAPPPTTHSTQASQSTTRLVTTTTKASLRLLSNHFKIKKPLAWQYKTFPGHSLILEVSSIFFVSSSCTLAPIIDFDPTQPLLSSS